MEFSPPLSRLTATADLLRAQAKRFWDWWTQELAGLIPERWRLRLRQRGDLLLIELDGQHCRLSFGSHGNAGVLASGPFEEHDELPAQLAMPLRVHAAKANQVLLRLPAEHGLRKLLSLPVATEAALANVLRFEMDRHTPFSSEQVYFGYRVLKREADRQRLQVELQLVPRSYLDPLLQRFAGINVHPDVVTLAEPPGAPEAAWVNLLPAQRRGMRASWRNSRPMQWLLLALGVSALVLLPLYQREYTAEQLQRELDSPKTLAEEAAAVRDELQALENGQRFLATQQARASEVLLLLDELTRLLPDHTWLTRFEIAADKVRLEGESAEASSLIGLLEQSQRLHNVSFTSPVTNNPRTQRDRFSLLAERRQPQAQP